ncbi:Rossmann-like and DUF2520 domain-containing protein [Facilibium subflavum]|uniref:Rossmann-like and DUF2520 domain-containing protein n=1 Tax=Facilibium subflavum TaxID=2219058 RepID=UPI000E65B4B9|nr:Rossmann-like and DUF2520 domain-containing protein [Facilibium subflavum]
MRQVSDFTPPANPCYGIVGQGRVGKHIAHYFSLLDINHLIWRRSDQSQPQDAFKNADIILLAIPDQCIEPFLLQYPQLRDKPCIHFSGALYTKLAFGFHPLMTFDNTLYNKAHYEKMLFVQDNDAPLFTLIFPALKNQFITIQSTQKAYYHSLCVMANNFTTILWQKFFKELEQRFDAPKTGLIAFANQTMKNIQHNPDTALTGPLVRNDQQTINSNLQSLAQDPFKGIYQSFVNTYQILKKQQEEKTNECNQQEAKTHP